MTTTSLDTEPYILHIDRPEIGLTAFIVIDQPSFEICAGGVRTRAYLSDGEALADAKALARAMTLKCALGGLPVGGAKAVVKLHNGLRRDEAFVHLGKVVESLNGRFRTAGDLGTFESDLALMATQTRFVHTNERELGSSVASGLLACLRSIRSEFFADAFSRSRVSVQGAGAIGSAVATLFDERGYRVFISDIDEARAIESGYTVIPVDEALDCDVEVISPCAVGGVISDATWSTIRAKIVCGGANNVVSNLDVHWNLHREGVLVVPDVISSAGAVVDGIGQSVMGFEDRTELISQLGETAKEVVALSKKLNEPPYLAAVKLAAARISAPSRF